MAKNDKNYTWEIIKCLLLVFLGAAIFSQCPESTQDFLRNGIRNGFHRVFVTSSAPNETKPVANKCQSDFIFAGTPVSKSYPNKLSVLINKGYVVAYDTERLNPAWVAYRVTPKPLAHAADRPSKFMTDPRVRNQVHHEDYTNTGYDRGHLAPNWAIFLNYGQEAQVETFLMTNIVPQKPNVNQGVWKEIEELEVKDYAERFEELWVICGPVYDDMKQELSSGIEIPDAFFKIFVDVRPDGSPRCLAFSIAQNVDRRADPAKFLTNVNKVEEVSGFDFFSELEDEVEEWVEKDVRKTLW